MKEQRESMTLEEVADYLSVDYQLIYKLVRAGDLPAVRIGRIYRVLRRDLDAYIERSKTVGPFACSACGQTYGSATSVRNGCAECGAAICLDCWTRKKERRCSEHVEADGKGGGKGIAASRGRGRA